MLSRATMTVVADYRGLKVGEMQTFRTTLRGLNADAKVAKNTLATIAARQVGKEALAEYLAGPTVLINAYGDPVGVAKAVSDFARTSRILKVRGGIAGQRAIDEAAVAQIATLPSREVLIARVVGQIQAPLYGLVGVLSGTIRKFAYVLQARIDQLGGVPQEEAAAAE
jgi:large subunit ribosomal protein L10